jgi:hypothetical protein
MPKRQTTRVDDDDDPDITEDPDPATNGTHRNRYEVTLDRLAAMSPKQLKELGSRLRDHEAGAHMMKMLTAGFSMKQAMLPEISD